MLAAQGPGAVLAGPAGAVGGALPGGAIPGGGCAAAPVMGPAPGYAGIGGPPPVGGGPAALAAAALAGGAPVGFGGLPAAALPGAGGGAAVAPYAPPMGGRRTGRCGRSPTSWRRGRLGRCHRRRGLPCANSRRRGRWRRKRRRRRSDPDHSPRSGWQEVPGFQRLCEDVPGNSTQRLPHTRRQDSQLLPESNCRPPWGVSGSSFNYLGSSVQVSTIRLPSYRARGVEQNLGLDALCGPAGCHEPLLGRNDMPQLAEAGRSLQGQDLGIFGCCCWIGLALLYFYYIWVRWFTYRPKTAEVLPGAGRTVVNDRQGAKESKRGTCPNEKGGEKKTKDEE